MLLPFKDLLSSAVVFAVPTPSRISLLAEENRGLRVPSFDVDIWFGVPLATLPMNVGIQSISQTRKLNAIVAAMMARNMMRQLPNRSLGRTPRAKANDSIPDVALSGRVKRMLGVEVLMNIGEAVSES